MGLLIPGSWVRAPRWAKLLVERYHNILKERNDNVLLGQKKMHVARLAQSVEHVSLKPTAVDLSPTLDETFG